MEPALLGAHESDHYWLHMSIQKCKSGNISTKHQSPAGPGIPGPWVHCFYLPNAHLIVPVPLTSIYNSKYVLYHISA